MHLYPWISSRFSCDNFEDGSIKIVRSDNLTVGACNWYKVTSSLHIIYELSPFQLLELYKRLTHKAAETEHLLWGSNDPWQGFNPVRSYLWTISLFIPPNPWIRFSYGEYCMTDTAATSEYDSYRIKLKSEILSFSSPMDFEGHLVAFRTFRANWRLFFKNADWVQERGAKLLQQSKKARPVFLGGGGGLRGSWDSDSRAKGVPDNVIWYLFWLIIIVVL